MCLIFISANSFPCLLFILLDPDRSELCVLVLTFAFSDRVIFISGLIVVLFARLGFFCIYSFCISVCLVFVPICLCILLSPSGVCFSFLLAALCCPSGGWFLLLLCVFVYLLFHPLRGLFLLCFHLCSSIICFSSVFKFVFSPFRCVSISLPFSVYIIMCPEYVTLHSVAWYCRGFGLGLVVCLHVVCCILFPFFCVCLRVSPSGVPFVFCYSLRGSLHFVSYWLIVFALSCFVFPSGAFFPVGLVPVPSVALLLRWFLYRALAY